MQEYKSDFIKDMFADEIMNILIGVTIIALLTALVLVS